VHRRAFHPPDPSRRVNGACSPEDRRWRAVGRIVGTITDGWGEPIPTTAARLGERAAQPDAERRTTVTDAIPQPSRRGRTPLLHLRTATPNPGGPKMTPRHNRHRRHGCQRQRAREARLTTSRLQRSPGSRPLGTIWTAKPPGRCAAATVASDPAVPHQLDGTSTRSPVSRARAPRLAACRHRGASWSTWARSRTWRTSASRARRSSASSS
jgi:hypothetical protein